MVPMLTCGLVRSNFAFATGVLLWTVLVQRPTALTFPSRKPRRSLAGGLGNDLLRDVRGNLGVGVELHAVAGTTLGLGPQVAHVAEHLRQRYQSPDDARATTLFHRLDDATA